MAAPSDQRALATRLAGLSDERLAGALSARGVSTHAPWQDGFDAAEALLEAASVDRALVHLPRHVLHALAAGDPVDDPAVIAGLLVDEQGRPYAAVAARALAGAEARPDAFSPAVAPPDPEPSTDALAAASAERVFATAGALADVLLAAGHTPFSRTGTGAVSAADRRRLVEAHVVDGADELDDLIVAATAAGLLREGDREWIATPAAAVWLSRPTGERWAEMAAGLRASLPPSLRTADGGYRPLAAWAAEFPLDAEWTARAERLARVWSRWGLIAADGTEPAWAQPVRGGAAPDPAPLAALLPAEIDRVYLQADLSAIAPGPLEPALDLRLRGLAHRESRAQASTYRFSAASIGGALSSGETADSMRAFLAGISLTGIPQPLEYLIESTAARHGLVTVRTDAATGRSIVESPDAALRATIAVDQALRPLGLVPEDEALVSRVAREAVYWSLVDARYPVVAVDDDGDALALRRGQRAAAEPDAPSPYARLIATLRAGESGGGDTDAAWLGRELELAVRARSIIAVEVSLPDGSRRTFTLEASGLGGGRLRGRDRGADIERTLPVSSIVSVRPAP
ncbi:helicase-associated domain-containing protein [Microbacterium sp. CJ88]|uniref:helicase-associated domain-containing protein n=1 Tax=Microbacterium sp. CJ88 TaxID=3445672 RepID=UPI003F660198